MAFITDNFKISACASVTIPSRDDHPWKHPFLTTTKISRFRSYSEQVWALAKELAQKRRKKLRCAFTVNMAQSMYKWARLACAYGVDSRLFLHPHDGNAISMPQWEEFDGEFSLLTDGAQFLASNPSIQCEVQIRTPEMNGAELYYAWQPIFPLSKKSYEIFLRRLRLIRQSPTVRHAELMAYPGFFPYYEWAEELAEFDVVYAASAPFAAYASGKPYCVFSVGGDLQFDCGRGDTFGAAMRQAFSSARFLFASNPHTLGHCRRLGMSNGIYLPYPMDTNRYCPGQGNTRTAWEREYGNGVYVLTTARIDKGVKGHSDEFFSVLSGLARARPELRFIFLGWGSSAADFERQISEEGLQRQMIVLNPVGKRRLIDYYRSCDVVLDQFVYGYYGATALEAASVGKPVIMKIREEQYSPLYSGDVAPVLNVTTPREVATALVSLIDSESLRKERGGAMRAWVLRNHGEEKTVPLMLSLLSLAADREALPRDLINPLGDPLSDDEIAYHQSCCKPLVQ